MNRIGMTGTAVLRMLEDGLEEQFGQFSNTGSSKQIQEAVATFFSKIVPKPGPLSDEQIKKILQDLQQQFVQLSRTTRVAAFHSALKALKAVTRMLLPNEIPKTVDAETLKQELHDQMALWFGQAQDGDACNYAKNVITKVLGKSLGKKMSARQICDALDEIYAGCCSEFTLRKYELIVFKSTLLALNAIRDKYKDMPDPQSEEKQPGLEEKEEEKTVENEAQPVGSSLRFDDEKQPIFCVEEGSQVREKIFQALKVVMPCPQAEEGSAILALYPTILDQHMQMINERLEAGKPFLSKEELRATLDTMGKDVGLHRVARKALKKARKEYSSEKPQNAGETFFSREIVKGVLWEALKSELNLNKSRKRTLSQKLNKAFEGGSDTVSSKDLDAIFASLLQSQSPDFCRVVVNVRAQYAPKQRLEKGDEKSAFSAGQASSANTVSHYSKERIISVLKRDARSFKDHGSISDEVAEVFQEKVDRVFSGEPNQIPQERLIEKLNNVLSFFNSLDLPDFETATRRFIQLIKEGVPF